MKFRDLNFSGGQIFVAMEYYYLILNRTYLVIICDEELIGIKVRGITSSEVNTDPLIGKATKYFSVTDDLDDPNSYINFNLFHKYQDLDIQSSRVMQLDNSNFKINFDDILNVYHDKKKKWGMGYYPHDGKIYVEINGIKKELIILGSQQGEQIAKFINLAIERKDNTGS